jgi:hypothetical protein
MLKFINEILLISQSDNSDKYRIESARYWVELAN